MITQAEIVNAIVYGRKISRASEILGPGDKTPNLFKNSGPAHLPPFLQAAFESKGDQKSKLLEPFEMLSLGMRLKMLELSDPTSEQLSALEKPGWYKRAKAAQKDAYHCKAEDLAKAIQTASKRIRKYENEERFQNPPALKLIGISIDGDLDISKLDLPFSIRLICCGINGALLLDRTNLTTLDLSGTVIRNGISANYLKTSGALRMRRLTSLSPLDFGGADIGATLDATDIITMPINHQPDTVSYVADRGVLNLSLATIAKDVRLIRSRIYGGINFRGTKIGGSLFLTELIVRAPLAAIEILAATISSRANLSSDPDAAASVSINAANDIARILHPLEEHIEAYDPNSGNLVDYASYERAVEALSGWPVTDELATDTFGSTLLARLILESANCRDSAIRAENLEVVGNVLASSLRSCGLFSLRYANIGGRFDLKGARLRDAKSIKVSTDELKAALKGSTEGPGKIANDLVGLIAEDLPTTMRPVLDMEEANIGGDFDLSRYHRPRGRQITREYRVEPSGWINVSKSIYHYGDEKIINRVTKAFCRTLDDPIKFLPVFFPGADIPQGHKERFNLRKDFDGADAGTDKYLSAYGLVTFLEAAAKAHDPDFNTTFAKAREILLEVYDNEKLAPDTRSADEAAAFRDFIEIPRDKSLSASEISDLIKRYPRGIRVAARIFGEIRSAMVLGHISLENASVEGSIKMAGVIANRAISSKAYLKKPFVNIENAKIGGDLDFRYSMGVHAVHATNAKINGSVKFFEQVKFDFATDMFNPIEARALLGYCEGTAYLDPDKDNAVKDISSHRFNRAHIGGDVKLVFDPRAGPSLLLFNTSIKGNLTIVPTFGSYEITREKYDRIVKNSKIQRDNIKVGLRRSVRAETIKQRLYRLFIEHIELRLSSERANARKELPRIDLRNTSTTVFGHSAGAWPHQDNLLVEGLKYERERGGGPLTPRRRTWFAITHNRRQNRLINIVVLLGVLITAFFILWGSEFSQLSEFGRLVGELNLAMGMLLTSFIILTLTMSFFSHPLLKHARPQAIDWLQLQRRHFNNRKISSAVFPLEPYIRAARVLRASGRTRSANAVELERLRNQRRALSLRLQWPLRIMLKLSDMTMGFGFKPMRAVVIALVVTIAGAMIANLAAYKNMVVATDKHRLELARQYKSVTGDEKLPSLLTPECLTSFQYYPKFHSTLYAIDIVVPFFDLNQDKYWTVLQEPIKDNSTKTEQPKVIEEQVCSLASIDNTHSADKDESRDGAKGSFNPLLPTIKLINLLWFCIILLELFGWLFTSFIAISVAAQIETILARGGD